MMYSTPQEQRKNPLNLDLVLNMDTLGHSSRHYRNHSNLDLKLTDTQACNSRNRNQGQPHHMPNPVCLLFRL